MKERSSRPRVDWRIARKPQLDCVHAEDCVRGADDEEVRGWSLSAGWKGTAGSKFALSWATLPHA